MPKEHIGYTGTARAGLNLAYIHCNHTFAYDASCNILLEMVLNRFSGVTRNKQVLAYNCNNDSTSAKPGKLKKDKNEKKTKRLIAYSRFRIYFKIAIFPNLIRIFIHLTFD